MRYSTIYSAISVGDDADQLQPVARIDQEAEAGDAFAPGRHRDVQRIAAEQRAHRFHQHDAGAEGDQDLVLGRTLIEQPHDNALDDHADQQHEHEHHDEGEEPRAGGVQHHVGNVGADHEQRAMREVQYPQGAQDDGQSARDQGEQ